MSGKRTLTVSVLGCVPAPMVLQPSSPASESHAATDSVHLFREISIPSTSAFQSRTKHLSNGGRVHFGRSLVLAGPQVQCSSNQPVALMVDHALREASAAEAVRAAQMAAAIGLQPVQLAMDWQGIKPKHGRKMRAAREGRYQLLVEACRRP